MSVRVMAQVWELELPDSEKIVLLALADCANDEGHCWPGMISLSRKCSKGERTIQGAIKRLVDEGHLTRREVIGKGCNYTVHPRSRCAPAEDAPPQGLQKPPQPLRPTPAAAAPKPSGNHKEPSPPKMRATPDVWWPKQFSEGTVSRKVVDGWPPGELEAQVEQFLAHHGSKNNSFSDLQKAFSTWVLNTRKFGIGNNGGRTNGLGRNQSSDGLSSTARAAMRVFGTGERSGVSQ